MPAPFGPEDAEHLARRHLKAVELEARANAPRRREPGTVERGRHERRSRRRATGRAGANSTTTETSEQHEGQGDRRVGVGLHARGRPRAASSGCRPARLPAKVIVAPNSPSARAQQSTAPATSDGPDQRAASPAGTTVSRRAPSVAAASSYPRSRTAEGALHGHHQERHRHEGLGDDDAPAVVNGRVMPNHWSRYCPTRPCRPSASSSATPPTTGGSTSGSVTRARSSRRPRNRAAGQHPGQRHADAPARSPSPRWRRSARARARRGPSGSARISGQPGHGARMSSRDERYAAGTARRSGPGRRAATGRRAVPDRRRAGPVGRGRLTDWRTRPPRAPPCPRRRGRGRRRPGPPSGSPPWSGRRSGRWSRRSTSAGISTPLTLSPADLHVGDVDDAGVDLAERDLGQHRLDVDLLG